MAKSRVVKLYAESGLRLESFSSSTSVQASALSNRAALGLHQPISLFLSHIKNQGKPTNLQSFDSVSCFHSPQDEDTSFHFDGRGYSVVEKALRSTVTQIILLFSTFSPNGLLLYLASNGTVSKWIEL